MSYDQPQPQPVASRRDRLTHQTAVGLGSFDIIDRVEPDTESYATDTYDIVASYLVTLSPLALDVSERRLTGLTLVHTDYADGEDSEGTPVDLPTDPAALDLLIDLLTSARDIVTKAGA